MVSLLIGRKGSGKTKLMLEMANSSIDTTDGSIVYINKDHRLMCNLRHQIRVVCMEDFEDITNSDEYIGFIFGIISSNHDIEKIFIDSILKHADFEISDIPEFLGRLEKISRMHGPDFFVSLSAGKEELIGVNFEEVELLN